jgi:hypothetical protein
MMGHLKSHAVVIEPVITSFHDFFEPRSAPNLLGHAKASKLFLAQAALVADTVRSSVNLRIEPLFHDHLSIRRLNGFPINSSRSQLAAYDPFCAQVVYESVDLFGRRSFFRSTFDRLPSFSRRLLNLKEIGLKFVAFLDGCNAKKKPFSPQKKSYTPHHRVTINLPLVC